MPLQVRRQEATGPPAAGLRTTLGLDVGSDEDDIHVWDRTGKGPLGQEVANRPHATEPFASSRPLLRPARLTTPLVPPAPAPSPSVLHRCFAIPALDPLARFPVESLTWTPFIRPR